MTEAEKVSRLKGQHGGQWGKHPTHKIDDWQYLVSNGDTRLGYWEWVQAQIDEYEGPQP